MSAGDALTAEQRREWPALASVFDQLAASNFMVDPVGFNPPVPAHWLALEIALVMARADDTVREAMRNPRPLIVHIARPPVEKMTESLFNLGESARAFGAALACLPPMPEPRTGDMADHVEAEQAEDARR